MYPARVAQSGYFRKNWVCGIVRRWGISQVSDAHAIIVSEETGSISVAYKGQFYLRLSAEELESLLTKEI